MSPARVDFVYNWSLTWAEFGQLQKKMITKYFSPVYQNVVFRFEMMITDAVEKNDADKFGLILTYEDGPVFELKDVHIYVDTIKDGKKRGAAEKKCCNLQRGGRANHIPNVDVKDAKAFKEKHGLTSSSAAHFRIYMSIPESLFASYKIEKPAFDPQPTWLAEMYPNLEDSVKAMYSDVKLVVSSSTDGGGGRKFYCHKMVLGLRSNVLGILLRNPQNENQKSGEYEFPDLNDEALAAVLKYLYTGDGDVVGSLSTDSVIRVGNFCEKFGLKDLKRGCLAEFWQRVVEKPEDAIEILRFADYFLLDNYGDHEARYLRDRALDVLTEKFEELSLKLTDFSKKGDNKGDWQGDTLREEFVSHFSRRLYVSHYD